MASPCVFPARGNRRLSPRKTFIYLESPEAEAAYRALDQRVTVTFENAPLDECMSKLAELTGTTVTIDVDSLKAEKIDPRSKVSNSLQDVRLEVALQRILPPLDLSWVIDDEGLVITTRVMAGETLQTALYPVGDLVTFDDDHEILMETLTNIVSPDSWELVGGPGTIAWVPQSECLAIRQLWEIHRQLRIVLRGLREAADIAAAARAAATTKPETEAKPVDPGDPAVRTAREILQENIQTLREVEREAEVKSEAKAK